MTSTNRTIWTVIQWALSAIGIPALMWAWSLSTQVQLQKQKIEQLEVQAKKSETHSTTLAEVNVKLQHLKEALGEIKDMLK